MTRLSTFGLLFLMVFAACAGDSEIAEKFDSTARAVEILHTLDVVDDLKAEFNQNSAQPRLILILSPT